MRPGEVVIAASIPLLIAAALLRIETMPSPAAVVVTRGAGEVVVDALMVTNGHPQVVALSAPRPHHLAPRPRVEAAAPARLPVTRPRTAVVAPTVVRHTADGYPYAHDTSGGSDPWGFQKRQCVSYVAWRLALAGRPLDNARDRWGSALTWDDTARRLGRAVSTTPTVGAVAQWNAGESSPYWAPDSATANGSFRAGSEGHVAWVAKVFTDGSVLVAQYNGLGGTTYSTMRVRAPRYLTL